MPQLYFGTGRSTITPAPGVELCGYGPYIGRRSTRVYQDLHCTALSVSDGESIFVWVSNDLIWTDRTLVDKTHSIVQDLYGLDPNRVVIANTHTHSGPATMKSIGWGNWDDSYTEGLPEQIAKTIGKAVSEMEPGSVGFGRATVPGLSVNRVDEGSEADETALLMRIDDPSGRMRVAIINFGAHPVTLGASTEICGDYPADAVKKIEARSNQLRVLFFQGSCGDLNCRGFGDGIEMMEANGSLLQGHVLPALDKIECSNDVTLDGDTYDIALPLSLPNSEELKKELSEYKNRFDSNKTSKEMRQIRFEIGWREMYMKLLDSAHPQRLEIRVSWMRINKAVLLAHPLELFLTFGRQIQAASPYFDTMIIGYANETVGYLARPRDFEQEGFGWYAAVLAPRICRHFPFDPSAGEVFRDHLIALLHRIKQRE